MDIALHIGRIYKECVACFNSIVIVMWFLFIILNYVHIDMQLLLLRLNATGS